jgi:glycerophosphoryl diester phosphodiesterase
MLYKAANMTRSFVLAGHRGARWLAPENTLGGIATAASLGANAIEVDVAVTADGTAVLSHDPALNPDITRGPDGVWLTGKGPLIRTLTLPELQQFNVGRIRPRTPYAALFREQSPNDEARIPALAGALACQPDLTVIAELKLFPAHPDWTVNPSEMADIVAQVADDAGAAARLIVESFDWRGPRHLRRTRPDIALAWLTRAETVRDAALWWGGPQPADFAGSVPRAVAAEGGGIWAPDHTGLTAPLIGEAQALGLRVIPWTVNHPRDMRRLISWGIDGIITDHPGRLRKVLEAANAE